MLNNALSVTAAQPIRTRLWWGKTCWKKASDLVQNDRILMLRGKASPESVPLDSIQVRKGALVTYDIHVSPSRTYYCHGILVRTCREEITKYTELLDKLEEYQSVGSIEESAYIDLKVEYEKRIRDSRERALALDELADIQLSMRTAISKSSGHWVISPRQKMRIQILAPQVNRSLTLSVSAQDTVASIMDTIRTEMGVDKVSNLSLKIDERSLESSQTLEDAEIVDGDVLELFPSEKRHRDT